MYASRRFMAAAVLNLMAATSALPQQTRLVTSSPFVLSPSRARSAAPLARPALLTVENVSLAKALVELRHSSGVPIAFSPSLLPERRVSCHCKTFTVRRALEHLLAGTPFRHFEVGRQVLVEPAQWSGAMDASTLESVRPKIALVSDEQTYVRPGVEIARQQGTIAGQVVDAGTQRPLVGAQVFIPGTGLGTLTSGAGRYRLAEVPEGEVTVRAQMIGYQTSERVVVVQSGQSVALDFALTQRALALDEIVVTGTPGGTQRRAIGNVVGEVEAAEVTRIAPVATIQDLLGAREPGLSFSRASGNVGTGSQVRIRGVSSFSMGTQPLIYVDGVRVDNEGRAGPSIRDGRQVSKLADFNPNDIASIEIIKGPAAATLYGTEASAGVIQIITKKGQTGEPQFDLMVRQGANWLMNPSEKIGRAYGTDPVSGDIISFNIWEAEKASGRQFFHTGQLQSYNLSMRGGTDLVRYFLSANYNDDVGIVSYNWDQGVNLRANVSVIPSPEFTLAVSTGFTDGKSSFMQQYTGYGVWEQAQWSNPVGQGRILRGFLRARPEEIAEVSATREYSRFTGSATLTHNPAEWFTQRLIIGTDVSHDQNKILFPRQPEGATHDFGGLSLGYVDLERPSTSYTTLDYAASADFDLVGWHWTSSVGAQYYDRREHTVFTDGRGFPSTSIRSLEGAATTTSDAFQIENKSFGLYVQQQAALNNRLFLTAAVRGDDNSAFGADYDAAIYPKLSAAWVISEEPFWPWSELVNSLRLRTAWGQAGRQPDVFAATTLYAQVIGPGGVPALTPEVLGNPDLGPEVSTELELGFDAALFDDRLSTQFTLYRQNINDALVALPVPTSSGFPGSQSVNLGSLSNKGWEVSIDARLFEQSSASLELGLGFTHNENRIEDLGGRPATGTVREGWPYPAMEARVILSGELDDQGRPTNLMCDGGAGELDYRGGPALPCDESPQVLLGPTVPQWEGSLYSTLTLFQDLSLHALVEWRGEHWRGSWDTGCRHSCFLTSLAANRREDPTFVAALDDVVESAALEISVFNAAFAKLRAVSANYVLPDSWANRIGASRASINVAGRNLWTMWVAQDNINGAPIHDPEAARADPLATYTNSNVPPLSSFLVTMRVSF